MKAAHSDPNAGPARAPLAAIWAVLAAVLLAAGPARPALAAGAAEELVEESRFSIERMLVDDELPELKGYVTRARGLLIIPQLVKGGFIVGAEAGSGVLMVRGDDGSWSAPVFVTLVAASIGLQIGGKSSKVLFAVMHDAALDALLSNKVKLGVDLGVAVAHVGAGLEASTTTAARGDIFQFAVSQGLFGGGALEGAVIEPRTSWNDAYYGRTLGAKAIVADPNLASPGADALRTALDRR